MLLCPVVDDVVAVVAAVDDVAVQIKPKKWAFIGREDYDC